MDQFGGLEATHGAAAVEVGLARPLRDCDQLNARVTIPHKPEREVHELTPNLCTRCHFCRSICTIEFVVDRNGGRPIRGCGGKRQRILPQYADWRWRQPPDE